MNVVPLRAPALRDVAVTQVLTDDLAFVRNVARVRAVRTGADVHRPTSSRMASRWAGVTDSSTFYRVAGQTGEILETIDVSTAGSAPHHAVSTRQISAAARTKYP